MPVSILAFGGYGATLAAAIKVPEVCSESPIEDLALVRQDNFGGPPCCEHGPRLELPVTFEHES